MTVTEAQVQPLPPVSPALAERGVALRRERQEDRDFLVFLFISTRWEELMATGWTDEEKIGFLSQQFQFQDAHYSRYYAETARGIVEENGQPIGRLYLYRSPSDHRIVDVSLIPAARNRGIGEALLRLVHDEAKEVPVKVSIHVEHFNPARRLYERLGFGEVSRDGVYAKMEWYPEGAPRD